MANSNTQTIKQRVLDILFEDEPDYGSSEKPHKKKSESLIKEINKERPHGAYKAADLLYGDKKEDLHSNLFIDLDEIKPTKKENKESNNENEVYVSMPNISPIFGTIDNNTKRSEEATSLDYATTKKPDTNYLDMVLSPIYGYDTKQANDARDNLKEPKEIKKVQSVDVTEDLFATLETRLSDLKTNKKTKEEKLSKTSEIDLFADFYTDKEE